MPFSQNKNTSPRDTCDEPIKTAKLQKQQDAELKAAQEKVRASLIMQQRMELDRTKLNNKKEQACLTEQNKSLESQLAQKDQIISHMREDAVKLQPLVQGVAEASNRPANFYPSSSSGK